MSNVVWNTGAPPSIGWWPASLSRNLTTIRWWDGKTWSTDVYRMDGPVKGAKYAAIPDRNPGLVEWRNRPKTWLPCSRT